MHGHALRILTAAALTSAVFAVVPAVDVHAQAAARTTSLTLIVHGCEGCMVQPVRAIAGMSVPVWRGKIKRRSGMARCSGRWRPGAPSGRLSTSATPTRSTSAPYPTSWWPTAASPWATGCRRESPSTRGTPLAAGRAPSRPRSLCGSGSSSSPLPLVSRRRSRASPSALTSSRQGPTCPPYTRTFHGQIGNQDAYFLSIVIGGTMRARRVLVSSVVAVTIGGMLLPPAAARARVGPMHTSAPRSVSTSGVLNRVAATSDHDIWAVGTIGGVYPDEPLVLHRGSGAWSTVPVTDPASGASTASPPPRPPTRGPSAPAGRQRPDGTRPALGRPGVDVAVRLR